MGLQNYKPRQREIHRYLTHSFEWPDCEGAGFTFNVDESSGQPIFTITVGAEYDEDGYHIYPSGTEYQWVYGTDLPEGVTQEDIDTHPGVQNYLNCVNGVYEIIDRGLVWQESHGVLPAHGECEDCGNTVWLYNDYGHGIDCECGAIYSGTGSRLAPRSQWEERYSDESTQPYWAEFGYGEDC